MSGRRARGMMARLGVGLPTESDYKITTDPRAGEAAGLAARNMDLRDRAERALAGHEGASLREVADALARIHEGAAEMRTWMVEVGRALVQLQRAAGIGGYKALRDADLVPFDESVASKLRRIATAVDGRLIPLDHLPRAIEPAVVAARMPPPEIARLLAEGVLRPEVTARELRQAAAGSPLARRLTTGSERQRLERRLATIAAARARLDAEEAEIRTRLAEA